MGHLLVMIAIMMLMAFVIGMAVAFVIDRATLTIDKIDKNNEKRPILTRAKKIHKISNTLRKKQVGLFEQKCHVEMIDHYYGNNKMDDETSGKEFIEHYYPSH